MRDMGFLLQLCLLHLLLFCNETSGQNGLFYPFGIGSGDTILATSDDGSSPIIYLSASFPYFGRLYNTLYVNNNGDLTFDSAWYAYIPYNFPGYANRDIIAPFWTDLDTRNHGTVSYRQVTNGQILQLATRDINQYFPHVTFTATWVFIATWDRVAYFPTTPTETSFQVVLISNGHNSFVLMNYGQIADRGNVQAGYDTINSVNYFSIPGSFSSSIVSLGSSSNVNVPGRWAFRTDFGTTGCYFNGLLVQVGSSFWTDGTCQQRCTCSSTGLQCQRSPCSFSQVCLPATFMYSCQTIQRSTCFISGDPHYYTFDGRRYDFQGTCTYVLSQAYGTTQPYYRVEGKNEHRGSTYVSWTRLVRVIAYDVEIVLLNGYPGQAMVNGVFAAAPFSLLNGSIQVYQSGFSVTVSTNFGLVVSYDTYHYVTISVPYTYYNQTNGLCGVFNFNPADDFLSSSEEILSSADEFANSWQVSTDADPQCQQFRCSTLNCIGCSAAQRNAYSSVQQCGILQDPSGPFAACHQQFPPQSYVENCVYDLCVGDGYMPILCQALSAYASQCQQHGIQVGFWRRQGLCEILCPANSHFESLGTSCPATCAMPTSPSTCTLHPQESCICDSGYVLSAGTCVPIQQCGCTFEGLYYSSGQTVLLDEDCGRQCTCNSSVMTCSAHSCGPHERCGVQGGQRSCQPLQYNTCWLEESVLYRTFDGATYHYPGACGLILSTVVGGSHLPNFTIATQKVPRGIQGNDFIRRLKIETSDIEVFIDVEANSTVQVNGHAVRLPFGTQSGHVRVYHSSVTAIVLETDLGVTLQTDWPYLVRLTAPSNYYGALRGLCGNNNNYNGDDFQMPDDTLVSSAEVFCDSWQIGIRSTYCIERRNIPGGNESSPYLSEDSCGIMSLPGGPFDQCRMRLDPSRRISDCAQSLSANGGDHSILCEAVRAYALLCQQNRIAVAEWRNYTNCDPGCPQNSHYEVCGTSCPVVCPSLSFPFMCTQQCQEGCQCDSGFLLNDGQCVTPSNCGCQYQDRYYQSGQSFWEGALCSNLCTCNGSTGNVYCSPSACSSSESCENVNGEYGCHPLPQGTCTAAGDPHYRTFDGRTFDFQGTCRYVLASPCNLTSADLQPFSVEARNQPINGVPVSFTAEVFISVYGHQVNINSAEHGVVRVDGVIRSLPLILDNGQVHVYQNGIQTSVNSDFGLLVSYDGWSVVSITVPSSYRGSTCGLCGNFNGFPYDDFVTRSGALAESPFVFGTDWQVVGNYSCISRNTEVIFCPDDHTARLQCDILHSEEGPLSFCHDYVSPDPYFSNCVFDVCVSGFQENILCRSIETYVAACQAAGARVYPWRQNTSCSIECPENSHYELCGSECGRTCSNVSATCTQSCTEGCFCDGGYLRSGNSCVPAEQCGCQHDGYYFHVGEEFWTPDCSQHCQCHTSQEVHCVSAGCTPTEECTVRDGKLGCFDRLSTCTVTGDPHYFTFDGALVHFQGTCSYEITRSCTVDANEGLQFQVVATNQHRGNNLVSFVSRVDVWLSQNGEETHITMEQRTVKVNDTEILIPSSIGSLANVSRERNFLVLTMPGELKVHFNGQNTLFVRLGQNHRNTVCGMCGNFNGDPTDDKVFPNGTITLSDEDFGDSWKSSISSPGCGATDDTDPLGEHHTLREEFRQLCAVISNSSGPFSACHLHVDPSPYFSSCVYDLCLYTQANGMLCSAVAAYEAACLNLEVQIAEWRSDLLCPLTDPCDNLDCTDQEWCGQNNGVYGCFCNEEHHRSNIDHYDSEKTCVSSSGSMSLSRCELFEDGFPSDILHLNDPNCIGRVHNGRVEFHFDNNGLICGTSLTSNGTHFMYQNIISGDVLPQNQVISRRSSLSLQFDCIYPLSQSLSMSAGIHPVERLIRKTIPQGEGHYQIRMIPYVDAEFLQPFSGAHMEITLNQQLYVAIQVTGVDETQISSVIDSCWATPFNDPNYSVRWDLIIHECPNPADGTVKLIENGVSTNSRFSFKMFEFRSNSSMLFLHCQVHLCLRIGNNCSSCCCTGSHQRERRSPQFVDRTAISIGPLIRSKRHADEDTRDSISAQAPSSLTSLLILVLCTMASAVLH